MTDANADLSVSHSTEKETHTVDECQALLTAAGAGASVKAKQDRSTTKCFRCENANFVASLIIILFTPFFLVPFIYLLVGLRSDLFMTYGTYISMCLYEAWIFAESVMSLPVIIAFLEKRKILGIGLFFIIFSICLVCAFFISFIEGGSISLFVGHADQKYILLEWKCIAFFALNAFHRYIFRNDLVKKGMCPVRVVMCIYCASWVFWAFFAGQIANNVMVSNVNDSWGTWGAFVQSMINGFIFSGHAMWHIFPAENHMDHLGMAIIISAMCVFIQMVLGYGIIVLFANIITGLYGTYITQTDIMLGVFMFSLVGTLVLTQISPLYKNLRSKYNSILFCVFHNVLYMILSLVYYIFFCLTVCPLATVLIAEEHVPVESIFPIVVFPSIAIIGMARVSRLYSANCESRSNRSQDEVPQSETSK